MIYSILAVIAGLAALVWSAGRFVDGAAALAKRLGLPPLLIGIVVIGIGTAMPELFVSATASWHGNSGIALGNAFGSNISNMALVLGLCSMVCPILVAQSVLNRELPIFLGAGALAVILVRDGEVSRLDACILLAAFVLAMYVTVKRSLADQEEASEIAKEVEESTAKDTQSVGKAAAWVVVALALMLGSSEALVWGAERIAEHFGVNDLVIGLTIVAVGTTLPELASSLIAARRGEHDMALGNVLGSVIFNTLAVVGVAGLIHPLKAEHDLIHRDIAVMAAIAVMLCMFCLDRKAPYRLSRSEGAILFLAYVAYALFLFLGSSTPGVAPEIW